MGEGGEDGEAFAVSEAHAVVEGGEGAAQERGRDVVAFGEDGDEGVAYEAFEVARGAVEVAVDDDERSLGAENDVL